MNVYASEQRLSQRRPAVVLVHGGPVPADQNPAPQDWEGFTGYAALLARAGLDCGSSLEVAHYPPPGSANHPPGYELSPSTTPCLLHRRTGPDLPKLLIRVGHEIDFLASTQDDFVTAAKNAGAALEVIEIPHAGHAFEQDPYDHRSRYSTGQAIDWLSSTLSNGALGSP